MLSDIITYSTNLWDSCCYYQCLFIYSLQSLIPHPKDIVWIIKKPVKYISASKRLKWYILTFCIHDWKTGLQLEVALQISVKLNDIIKEIIKHRRPFQKYDWIKSDSKKKTNSYSLPSMSVQNTMLIYPIMFNSLNIPYVASSLYWMVVISRTLRGLHYPHDIVLSTILGKYLRDGFYYLCTVS
tara:strand:- start:13 stop:564 length:552 start_codon:yes stop_codon:yes gene_type:complete